MGVITIKEYGLTTNSFNEPIEYEDAQAMFVLLKRLLILNPGTYPNHPYMGVGLFSRWKFSDMEDMSDLKNEIQNQITQYLPQLQMSTIEISKKSTNELLITIRIQNVSYTLEASNGELSLINII